MTSYVLPDLTNMSQEDRIAVCWDWICKNYPGQEGKGALAFFDMCYDRDDEPDAWAVARAIKQRAITEGFLR